MTSMLIDLDQASQMVFESAQKMAAHIPLFSGSKRQRGQGCGAMEHHIS